MCICVYKVSSGRVTEAEKGRSKSLRLDRGWRWVGGFGKWSQLYLDGFIFFVRLRSIASDIMEIFLYFCLHYQEVTNLNIYLHHKPLLASFFSFSLDILIKP